MADYLPIRTLQGESGKSAIYRLELTEEQRRIVADGGDLLVEILHFGGPLAPSRAMVLNQSGLTDEERSHFARWLAASLRIAQRTDRSGDGKR
jgi:hypothetical protein